MVYRNDTSWYEQGREQIFPEYDKCFNYGADYVEK